MNILFINNLLVYNPIGFMRYRECPYAGSVRIRLLPPC